LVGLLVEVLTSGVSDIHLICHVKHLVGQTHLLVRGGFELISTRLDEIGLLALGEPLVLLDLLENLSSDFVLDALTVSEDFFNGGSSQVIIGLAHVRVSCGAVDRSRFIKLCVFGQVGKLRGKALGIIFVDSVLTL